MKCYELTLLPNLLAIDPYLYLQVESSLYLIEFYIFWKIFKYFNTYHESFIPQSEISWAYASAITSKPGLAPSYLFCESKKRSFNTNKIYIKYYKFTKVLEAGFPKNSQYKLRKKLPAIFRKYWLWKTVQRFLRLQLMREKMLLVW